jgi:hypothetical protein
MSRCQSGVLHQPQRDGGVEVAAAASHHQTGGRGKPHGGVDGVPVADRRPAPSGWRSCRACQDAASALVSASPSPIRHATSTLLSITMTTSLPSQPRIAHRR